MVERSRGVAVYLHESIVVGEAHAPARTATDLAYPENITILEARRNGSYPLKHDTQATQKSKVPLNGIRHGYSVCQSCGEHCANWGGGPGSARLPLVTVVPLLELQIQINTYTRLRILR